MSINSLTITNLPEEVLSEILEYLDKQSLCVMRAVNKQFLEIASDNQFWKFRFQEKFPKATLPNGENNYFELFKQWSRYWKKDAINEVIVQGNFPKEMTNISLQGDLIISTGLFSPIRVWNWRTQEDVFTLQGHQDNISCFAIHNDILVSGFHSGRLEVWNWPAQKLLEGFEEESPIKHIVINESIAILGTYKQNIPLWDLRTTTRIGELKGLSMLPRCLALQGSVVAAGDAWNVCVWNWQTQDLLITFPGFSKSQPACMEIQESGLLVLGCSDKTVRILNWRAKECLSILRAHEEWPTNLALQGDIVVSGSFYEDSIHLWNLRTQEHIACLNVGQYDMRCLALQGDTLVCGAVGGAEHNQGLVIWKTHQPY